MRSDFRINRERKDFPGHLFGDGQIAFTITQVSESFLEVHRRGIVKPGAHPPLRKVAPEFVPPLAFKGVIIERVNTAVLLGP